MIHLPPLPRLLAHPLLLIDTTSAPPLSPQVLSIQFIPCKPRAPGPPLARRSHSHRPRPSSIPEMPTPRNILHRASPPQASRDLFIVHHDHHPHPDLLVAAHQRRAVDPARLALDVAGRAAEPGDLGRDAGAVREGVQQAFAHVLWAADAVEEFRL